MFPDRFHELSERYRRRVECGPRRESIGEIAGSSNCANLHRTKQSHRGIGEFSHLRRLVAGAVNQDYLQEIGRLADLVELDLQWPMRAPDISPLAALSELEVLHVDSPTKVEDWSPLYRLPSLKVLTIENPRAIGNFAWAIPLMNRLEVFGIEGTINANLSVENIEPLRGAAIEAFFCASLTVRSKDLSPLHECPNLKLLSGGVLAPWREYMALREAKPDLVCQWFDPSKWLPSWRDGPSEAERLFYRK